MTAEAVAQLFKLIQLKEFFGYAKLADFSADWKRLGDKDKTDIKSGFVDGTMTY